MLKSHGTLRGFKPLSALQSPPQRNVPAASLSARQLSAKVRMPCIQCCHNYLIPSRNLKPCRLTCDNHFYLQAYDSCRRLVLHQYTAFHCDWTSAMDSIEQIVMPKERVRSCIPRHLQACFLVTRLVFFLSTGWSQSF